jgi:hypothetical protein
MIKSKLLRAFLRGRFEEGIGGSVMTALGPLPVVTRADIRDLRGLLEREKAAIGVFITLEPPTAEMTKEAISTGYYTSPTYLKKYPRLQILCIEDLLRGDKVQMPPTGSTFKIAERVKKVELPNLH